MDIEKSVYVYNYGSNVVLMTNTQDTPNGPSHISYISWCLFDKTFMFNTKRIVVKINIHNVILELINLRSVLVHYWELPKSPDYFDFVNLNSTLVDFFRPLLYLYNTFVWCSEE